MKRLEDTEEAASDCCLHGRAGIWGIGYTGGTMDEARGYDLYVFA